MLINGQEGRARLKRRAKPYIHMYVNNFLYGRDEVYQLKERLYELIAQAVGEKHMTIDRIVREIRRGTGEDEILQLQARAKKGACIGQFLPDEVKNAVITYEKSQEKS